MHKIARITVQATLAGILGLTVFQGLALAQGLAPIGAGNDPGNGLVGADVNPLSKLTGNTAPLGAGGLGK